MSQTLFDHPVANAATIVLDRFEGSPKEELFAVGDVHGRADLLERCLLAVSSIPPIAGMPRRLVMLGDLTDRGPAGIEVIDLVRSAPARLGHPVTALMGNHDMMLAIITCEEVPADVRRFYMRLWTNNGGEAVLDELAMSGHDIDCVDDAAPALLAVALGPERLAFLRGMPSHYVPPGGDVMFVHAGLHPYVAPSEFFAMDWRAHATMDLQEHRSWAWVREPFLEHVPSGFVGKVGHHGHFVIHGHTPHDGLRMPLAMQVARDRLNLDTMAFSRGALRMARILGNRVQVFDVGPFGPKGQVPLA